VSKMMDYRSIWRLTYWQYNVIVVYYE
jgi:hypothetical protein